MAVKGAVTGVKTLKRTKAKETKAKSGKTIDQAKSVFDELTDEVKRTSKLKIGEKIGQLSGMTDPVERAKLIKQVQRDIDQDNDFIKKLGATLHTGPANKGEQLEKSVMLTTLKALVTSKVMNGKVIEDLVKRIDNLVAIRNNLVKSGNASVAQIKEIENRLAKSQQALAQHEVKFVTSVGPMKIAKELATRAFNVARKTPKNSQIAVKAFIEVMSAAKTPKAVNAARDKFVELIDGLVEAGEVGELNKVVDLLRKKNIGSEKMPALLVDKLNQNIKKRGGTTEFEVGDRYDVLSDAILNANNQIANLHSAFTGDQSQEIFKKMYRQVANDNPGMTLDESINEVLAKSPTVLGYTSPGIFLNMAPTYIGSAFESLKEAAVNAAELVRSPNYKETMKELDDLGKTLMNMIGQMEQSTDTVDLEKIVKTSEDLLDKGIKRVLDTLSDIKAEEDEEQAPSEQSQREHEAEVYKDYSNVASAVEKYKKNEGNMWKEYARELGPQPDSPEIKRRKSRSRDSPNGELSNESVVEIKNEPIKPRLVLDFKLNVDGSRQFNSKNDLAEAVSGMKHAEHAQSPNVYVDRNKAYWMADASTLNLIPLEDVKVMTEDEQLASMRDSFGKDPKKKRDDTEEVAFIEATGKYSKGKAIKHALLQAGVPEEAQAVVLTASGRFKKSASVKKFNKMDEKHQRIISALHKYEKQYPDRKLTMALLHKNKVLDGL
jgi:hypothetical protein